MAYKIILSILFLFIYHLTYAECSTFCFSSGDTVILGNTLDWYVGDGIIVINKRNVTKTSMWYANPAKWTSKYGSITINQWGREFPSRGMNEAGLAIGEMTLSSTRFPNPDLRAPITLLQWIQYQLDNCATVEEVIASDKIIRIQQGEYTSHFFVADKKGNCVTMEWIDGKLVYHTSLPGTQDEKFMPVKALTNEPYSVMIKNYQSLNASTGGGSSSVARFYRIAKMINEFDPAVYPAVDYAFRITQSVGPNDWTKWRIVFDLTNLRFYFKTNVNSNLRFVDFNSFNFDCTTPVKMADANSQLSGNISANFINYDYDLNKRIFTEMAAKLAQHMSVSREAVDRMCDFPETTTCGGTGWMRLPWGEILDFELQQNYPNPFNTSTVIQYTIHGIYFDDNEDILISLKIFNPLGNEITELVNEFKKPGSYEVEWNANGLASGVYFYSIILSGKNSNGYIRAIKKMILLN